MHADTPAPDPVRRHLRFGWWALLCFLTIGLVLESLHGFKVRWYLDVANESRRLQWTLGHSHGTLLALVNVAYGLGLRALGPAAARVGHAASSCVIWAAVLMPAGFLLGGAFPLGPDPGFGVALVPIGAALLFVGVLSMARACDAWGGTASDADSPTASPSAAAATQPVRRGPGPGKTRR